MRKSGAAKLRGPVALSRRTRARLLTDLLQRADAGDAHAAGMLIALSIMAQIESEREVSASREAGTISTTLQ
ncbi:MULTISPECIES: hypothetical protein [Roseomonadaceae]|uniref:Uncharacterized protein n=1 Tax=Falsiroseomonas oleicola TaxID=2801474 RepID=A0ABS6HCV6_9PROT|nr:hypothetical protein [Roseomonas oleicola]MBU8545788.1 hypothetical protein [Roseomonas oleicola]